jgi:hypothetical protein
MWIHVHACAQPSLAVSQQQNAGQVVDVDLGSSVPTIANLRALPCPTDALWPQVVFDLDYPGDPP